MITGLQTSYSSFFSGKSFFYNYFENSTPLQIQTISFQILYFFQVLKLFVSNHSSKSKPGFVGMIRPGSHSHILHSFQLGYVYLRHNPIVL
jgi:hypothetical protein